MSAFDGRALRDAFGRFATGVAVITLRRPTGEAVGITVNSFSSVSMDPPLVLWCLGLKSERYSEFAATERYGVNILHPEGEPEASRLAFGRVPFLSKESEAEVDAASPILRSAIAWFDCKVIERWPAGDHLILLGQIERFGADDRPQALTYYRGKFGTAEPEASKN
jgi:flavin reductase (DIM6/NTAB) family NADH-FMN oxidoreductase RutF